MTFNNFIKSILFEKHDIEDLPDVAPYGFWVSPSGRYKAVKQRFGHHDAAKAWVLSHELLVEKFIKYMQLEDFANDEKLRSIPGSYYNDFLYEQEGYVRMVKDRGQYWYSHLLPLKPKQKNTVEDLGIFYRLPAEFDRSA